MRYEAGLFDNTKSVVSLFHSCVSKETGRSRLPALSSNAPTLKDSPWREDPSDSFDVEARRSSITKRPSDC
jgi:hypothetical protein